MLIRKSFNYVKLLQVNVIYRWLKNFELYSFAKWNLTLFSIAGEVFVVVIKVAADFVLLFAAFYPFGVFTFFVIFKW